MIGTLDPGPGVKRGLVICDEQFPHHDPLAISAVQNYARTQRWDYFVHLGDGMDFDEISHYSKTKAKELANYNFARDYEAYGRHLDAWSEAVEHKARQQKKALPEKYFIEGNHEHRIVKYLEEHPQMNGLLEVPIGLELDRRGYIWVPFWSEGEILTIGHASFIHGTYVNMYHAKKHAMTYGTNIFYGHTHDVMCFPLTFQGKGKTIVGQSLGCLCEEQDYMRGRPNKWQQAFGVFYWDSSGMFSYYVPRIFHRHGRAGFIAPDGQYYMSS